MHAHSIKINYIVLYNSLDDALFFYYYYFFLYYCAIILLIIAHCQTGIPGIPGILILYWHTWPAGTITTTINHHTGDFFFF